MAIGVSTIATPAMAVNNSKAGAATTTAVAPAPASSANIGEAVNALKAEYGQPAVVKSATRIVVSFSDKLGKHYSYTFARASSTSPSSGSARVHPNFSWGWNAWYLNRGETYDLYVDGAYSAVIYAIGVAFGCVACAVGAAIEGYWATIAWNAWSSGQCVKIYYWLQATQYSGGHCH